MKTLMIFYVSLLICVPVIAQELEVEGRTKITDMELDNNADSLVVRQADGTLAIRHLSTIVPLFSVSFIGDTLNLGTDNGIIIPGISNANYSVQGRLNAGVTPFELLGDGGIPMDSLLGKVYQGGLIFYLRSIDSFGLVAALSDQGFEVWGCNSFFVPGADLQDYGSGFSNTAAIVNNCGVITAASVAATYNDGIYFDWFLPARNTLQTMYSNLKFKGLGDFGSFDYWSSTQNSAMEAFEVDFANGSTNSLATKDSPNRVRPVRIITN